MTINPHALRVEHPASLEQAIQHEIAHKCHRQVDKRLALKLALALLHGPTEHSIFHTQRLVDALGERIAYRSRIIGERL